MNNKQSKQNKQIKIVTKQQRSGANAVKKKNARKNNRNNKITNNLISQQLKQNANNPLFRKNSGVRDFARVYTNPFTELGARIPVFPVEATQLICTKARGGGSTNGAGRGWVMLHTMHGVTNDTSCVKASTTTSGDFPSAIDPNASSALSNSPYPTEIFFYTVGPQGVTGPQYMARPVAAGIRWRYTGTSLNLSGISTCCQVTPRNATPEGLTPSDMFAIPSKEYVFDRKWRAVCRQITSHEDFLFQSVDKNSGNWTYENDTTSLSLDSYYNLVADIFCEANVTFEWEAYWHFEIKGKNLQRIGTVQPDRPNVEKLLHKVTTARLMDKSTPDHQVPTGGVVSGIFKEGVTGLLEKAVESFF